MKSCIIDSETVSWDSEKKQILPFQISSTKKRKVLTYVHYIEVNSCTKYPPSQDADVSNINIQVCVYAFDLLYLNGKVSNC